MKESILQKIRRLSLDINEKILPGASFLERIRIMYDFLWEKIWYDVELIDYLILRKHT